MKRLILLSKNFTVKAAEKLKEFTGKQNSAIHIAFCSSAADLDSKDTYVAEASKQLQEFGYQVSEFDLKTFTNKPQKFKDFLQNFDATFFTGGSSLYLNYLFHEYELANSYSDFVKEGNIIHIGFSAGAIVCSQNLDYAKIIDGSDGVPQYYSTGLSLIDFGIAPHVGDKEKYTLKYQAVLEKFPELKNSIFPLNNQQGIIVNDEVKEFI